MPLTVATLNILNTADRWAERRPLIVREFASLLPDLFGIQEVDFSAAQDERIADGADAQYASFRAYESADFGNSLLVRRPSFASVPDAVDGVDLGRGRAAVIVPLTTVEGMRLSAATAHLAWEPDHPQDRLEQVRRLLQAIEDAGAADATVVTGDFNAPSDEPAIGAMREAGFESAYARANGAEPDWTYPSPATPADIAVRAPSCIDYVWIRGEVQVQTARTGFDRPEGGLFPSDHRAVIAELDVRSA